MKRKLHFPAILLFTALAVFPVLAQPAGSASPSGSSGASGMVLPSGASTGQGTLTGVEAPIISESYMLMPGDVFLVTVNGSMTYSYNAMVTYEGKITINIPIDAAHPENLAAMQVVDVIRVSGLNMKSAQDSMSNAFRRLFREATVRLTLTGMRVGVVFVTGEVQEPGVYYAYPVERVSQVVAKAEGLTPLGSKTGIQLIRAGKLFANVNIEAFENDGDLAANPFVESGDRIYVPTVTGSVTVKGAVFGRGEYRLRTSALTTEKERISEGVYELNPGDRVLNLIKRAGGITPWADLGASYISRRDPKRRNERYRVDIDLTRALFQGDTAANVLLSNDDILVIPPINTLVYVEGEVAKPNSFLYTPNLKFEDYMGMAGGPTIYAHISKATVRRGGKLFRARGNPVIEPGDVIMIPRVGVKWWQDYLSIISAVAIPVTSALVSYLVSRNQ